MATYTAARAAIAATIAAVAITDPDDVTIATVHETRPDAGVQGEAPSVLITGFAMRYQRGAGGKRERLYSVGLRLMVRPTALSAVPMQETLDALKNAISEAFDTKVTLGLGGGYSVVEGPNWSNTEPTSDGGVLWDEGEIIISIKDTATFTP